MKIAIVCGSKNDLPKLDSAVEILNKFNITHEVKVLSAHRNPQGLKTFIEDAECDGVDVFIAAAGMAAHLPGVIASLTALPVIGVPLSGGVMGGLDALLAVVQMPGGVPVATVAVDGAKNAALLAVQILAVGNAELYAEVCNYKDSLAQ